MKLQRVTEIMTEAPIDTVEGGLSVAYAASVMKERERGSLVVLDKGRAVGIITERDLVRRVIAANKDPENTKVMDIMSTPLISVGPEATVEAATKIMYKNAIRRLPVLDGDRLVGIITVTDLVKGMLKERKEDEMLLAMGRFGLIEESNR